VKHPLITGKKYIIYLAAWAIIIIAHASLLYFYFHFNFQIALIDSGVFNFSIAILGFAFGFAFKYLSADSSAVNTMVSYLALILVGTAAIVFPTEYVLTALLDSTVQYVNFVENAKLWRISAAIFYFAIIVISYYIIHYNQDILQSRENQLRLEGLLKETELDVLKAQINPHFIFNSLNSISALTISAPNKAQEMVIKLSDFLRYSLGNNDNQLSTLKEEMNNIGLYLEIEKVRFEDRLVVSNQIDPRAFNAKLPNMILQPLYENAMKYGVYETIDQVEIQTTVSLVDNVLVVQISNNYDT